MVAYRKDKSVKDSLIRARIPSLYFNNQELYTVRVEWQRYNNFLKYFKKYVAFLGNFVASCKCKKSKRFFFKIPRLSKDYQIAQCLNWPDLRKNSYQSFHVLSGKINSSQLNQKTS